MILINTYTDITYEQKTPNCFKWQTMHTCMRYITKTCSPKDEGKSNPVNCLVHIFITAKEKKKKNELVRCGRQGPQ